MELTVSSPGAPPVAATPPDPYAFELPEAFEDLFRPYRYKVYYGGRGSAKSWSIARYLIMCAHTERHRLGCFRELQSSISDSVHKLLRDQIDDMRLERWFYITDKTIRSRVTGTEFLFKGLRHNAPEIKSTEGLTKAWVEEAQLVSKESWEVLIPTVRAEGSEIIVSFNPLDEEDVTYQKYVIHPPPNSTVHKVNYDANPFFPAVLDAERLDMLQRSPEDYAHVWEGEPKSIAESVIFKGKYIADVFDSPVDRNIIRHYGLDFGFANDPTVIISCWTTGPPRDQHLWVDYAEYGRNTEIVDLPDLLRRVPGSAQWSIFADNSRPETISYLAQQGFRISGADKWSGSVEDGIAHLRGFRMIHIHQRCKEALQEARLYKWKVDKVTEKILPVPVDANNHFWDALRYSLDKYIKKRGGNVFERI